MIQIAIVEDEEILRKTINRVYPEISNGKGKINKGYSIW